MFKTFLGFDLVEALHLSKAAKRFKKSHYIKMIICMLVSLFIACMPAEWFAIEGLTVIEQRVMALFFFAASMWITEAMPAWGTSFLVIVIMLITISDAPLKCFAVGEVTGEYGHPVSYKSIMATLADPTIMLFLGGFVLAIGMTKTKLDVYLAKVLLKPFGCQSKYVLLGFILVTAIFSAFVSNTATAAMMLTFLAPVLKAMGDDVKGRTALALAIPLGANIGGIATPIGTPPNIIALGYLSETLGTPVTFGSWILRMTPFVVFMLFVGWFLLRAMFPFKQKEVHLEIEGEFQKNKETWVVICTFIVTVFLWCFGDLLHLGLNSYIIALIPVASFIVFGVFTKKDLEEINWGVLWMVAGGFALGLALNATHLSNHLVASIPFGTWSFAVVIVAAVAICYCLSNLISHSATAALLVPVLGVVAGSMADATGNTSIPMQMLVAVAVASSVAMILPISTPPNAIAHSTGIIEQKDMMKVGVIVGTIGLVCGVAWLLLIF